MLNSSCQQIYRKSSTWSGVPPASPGDENIRNASNHQYLNIEATENHFYIQSINNLIIAYQKLAVFLLILWFHKLRISLTPTFGWHFPPPISNYLFCLKIGITIMLGACKQHLPTWLLQSSVWWNFSCETCCCFSKPGQFQRTLRSFLSHSSPSPPAPLHIPGRLAGWYLS